MLHSYDLHPNPDAATELVGLAAHDVERALILATLRTTQGNRTHAAAILGVSIRTIRNKLSEYQRRGIDVPSASAADDD